MSDIIIVIIVVVVVDITVTEMLSDRSPDWIEDTWMNMYLVTVFTNAVEVTVNSSSRNIGQSSNCYNTTGTVRNCNHAHQS